MAAMSTRLTRRPTTRSRRSAASASTSGNSGTPPRYLLPVRVVIAHNRYRSAQPSGENVIVDAEIAQLETAGVEVVPFLRSSDDIGALPMLDKALLPVSPIY